MEHEGWRRPYIAALIDNHAGTGVRDRRDGEVDLEPVDLDSLDTDEVQELARSSNYTWEFRNSGGSTDEKADQYGETPSTVSPPTNGDDRPPTDAD